MKTIKSVGLILLFSILLVSCDKVFEYSPYSANVPEKMENTTQENLDKIQEIANELPAESRLKIAFISDNHLNYNDLDNAVDAINRDSEVLFTIHAGDMTDGGMLAEYMIFRNITEKLHQPYLTVIGNHDCLANGEIIYKSIFGKENYTLIFKGNKFIFFNDIIWELNDREPDFLWLRNELSDFHSYRHVFVVTHIPPWSDQYSPFQTFSYKSMMYDSQIAVSIHGHHHDSYLGPYFNDSIQYLVVGSVDKKSYYELTIEADTFELKKVSF